MISKTMISSPDRLWTIVAEFGSRARAHPERVERAILDFMEAEDARQRAAKAGLFDPLEQLADAESNAMTSTDSTEEEKSETRCRLAQKRTELARLAWTTYCARVDASQPEAPSTEEMISYLAQLHDLVVAEDRDGDRRPSRRPLAPALDAVSEVRWTLLVLPEDVPCMRADMENTGGCRASEYLAAVRSELPLLGEAGQQVGSEAAEAFR
jgi:hypothetical protein